MNRYGTRFSGMPELGVLRSWSSIVGYWIGGRLVEAGLLFAVKDVGRCEDPNDASGS
jgi:hypothetical protein